MTMKIKLISHTPEPEKVVTSAAKLCYSPVGIKEIQEGLNEEKINRFINMLMSMGHESPIEHVSFTFAVEGVSRATSHQLIRHRIASFSQQSQRYVTMDNPDYVTPDSIRKNAQALGYYHHILDEITSYYNTLIDLGIPKEDARYLLPNATTTKLIITMNTRSLFNFFKLRCCNRAQWEIRELADKMLIECKKVAPTLFKYAGASCMFGDCPEGKMSCGNPRTPEEYQ